MPPGKVLWSIRCQKDVDIERSLNLTWLELILSTQRNQPSTDTQSEHRTTETKRSSAIVARGKARWGRHGGDWLLLSNHLDMKNPNKLVGLLHDRIFVHACGNLKCLASSSVGATAVISTSEAFHSNEQLDLKVDLSFRIGLLDFF